LIFLNGVGCEIYILSNSCYLWGGKIALFDKALVWALARGALAMCAMWVGNCFKKCVVGKNKKHWVGLSVGFLVL